MEVLGLVLFGVIAFFVVLLTLLRREYRRLEGKHHELEEQYSKVNTLCDGQHTRILNLKAEIDRARRLFGWDQCEKVFAELTEEKVRSYASEVLSQISNAMEAA